MAKVVTVARSLQRGRAGEDCEGYPVQSPNGQILGTG